jgi:hypothetical protein
MTDREGLFSKGRNLNSSQPVARPLPLNRVSARQGRGKKTRAVLYLSSKRPKCYAVSLTDGWMEIVRQACLPAGRVIPQPGYV